MSMMGPATPTRREVVILSLLLFVLLLITRGYQGEVWYHSNIQNDNSTTSTNRSDINPNPFQLPWTTEVPQTEVLAHVPGNP
jgi:hypothetical protein